MSPRLSVVMPCYNGMKYIAEAVDSVLTQSMSDFELIISDNGSTDGTIDYLRSQSDPRIKVHFQPTNRGIFGNLNFLFSRASAPLTQILCHDDYLLDADALQRILTIWKQLPAEVAFLRCGHGYDGSMSMRRLEQAVLPRIVDPKDSDLYFFVFGCIPGSLSNVSIRTPVVEQMGWYRADMDYSGDFEFWSRTGRARPWALDSSRVVYNRNHSEQASNTLNRHGDYLPQQYSIVERIYRELRNQGYNTFDLRVLATVIYALRYLDNGVKEIFKGRDWRYFKWANRWFVGTECFLGAFSTWLLYAVTAGGRLFAPLVAKRMLSRPRA